MAQFQNILVLHTAMNGCHAGFYSAADSRSVIRSEAMLRGQSERLMPMIEEIMAEAGCGFDALDAVLCTVGPGAFTGMRIGLAAARALGLALDIPVIGITTLQALAWQYAQEEKPSMNIGVVIETKRDDFYFQAFDQAGNAMNDAAALDGGAIAQADYILIGDGVERLTGAAGPCSAVRPDVIAALLAEKGAPSAYFTAPEPVYLRGADVSTPKKKQRKIQTNP